MGDVTGQDQGQDDHIAHLKLQLAKALKHETSAIRAVEAASQKRSAATAVVDALKAELGLCLIDSWGETPDLSILLSGDESYGLPMYQAFRAWSDLHGYYVPGGYFPDTQQWVIGIGVDAGEVSGIDRAKAMIERLLPVLKPHADGRTWLRIQQNEYQNCAWELRIRPDGDTQIVCLQYGMVQDEVSFGFLHSALHYVREHLPCSTTFDGDGAPLLIEG